ncbi:hypothetical protein HHK36_009125 [Tetracentron sinense]|uniref:O-fucosyltransferase family protein n=1 Tax=Tetracentron sinense TaxID=13715 RepID=A0A834ZFN7_TETSI|nr:hypothetical protein HHK36_009125 [Tetracentron sinense]
MQSGSFRSRSSSKGIVVGDEPEKVIFSRIRTSEEDRAFSTPSGRRIRDLGMGSFGILGPAPHSSSGKSLEGRFWDEASEGSEMEHYTPLVFNVMSSKNMQEEQKIGGSDRSKSVTQVEVGIVGEKEQALIASGLSQNSSEELDPKDLLEDQGTSNVEVSLDRSPVGLKKAHRGEDEHCLEDQGLEGIEASAEDRIQPSLGACAESQEETQVVLPHMCQEEVFAWVVNQMEGVGKFLGLSSDGFASETTSLFLSIEGGLKGDRGRSKVKQELINRFFLFTIFCSKFGDIFDEEFFIYALRNNVKVVKELPGDILQRFDSNISNIVNLRVKAWSSPTYYMQKVLPKLLQMGAVRIAPFSNRLAHAVPSNIQVLRCLANYEALRFSQSIRMLAENMVDRMIKNSSMSGGKYISVHLRFEEDMVAFSCCTYDGGEEEKHEMDIARERSWRGKFNKRGRVIRPGAIRMDGKCPLTPLEVGMMLRGMGFDNRTSVFVAAGKIYKAEKYMAPLRKLFPLLETKDTLASPEELAPFKGHSSRLAALDYTVCLHSEVFVTTQGGNFPHFLMGHRRYLYGGHAKTIKPDKRKLALLFDSPNIRWENFKRQMKDMLHHSDLKGNDVRKPSSLLYTFPMPDCMCKQVAVGKTDGNTTII